MLLLSIGNLAVGSAEEGVNGLETGLSSLKK